MSAYTVAVLNKGKFLCNGAIVHNEFIVTSASCVHEIKSSELIVRAGSDKYNIGGVEAEISKIITHKKFKDSSHDYDVAVLKLKGCLAITSSNIEEIAIPSEKHIEVKEGILSGWIFDGVSAESLQFYKVNVYRRSECEQIGIEKITKRMICAEITDIERCINFPQGSPLVSEGKLIGILSFGFPCDQSLPDIFTNISVLFKFIQNVIKRFA